MTVVQDDQLFIHSDRAAGKVVLITGAANGIGKEAALRFVSYGAKVVIGDLDEQGGNATVEDILKNGGQAVFRKCNVTQWEDQLALFNLAITNYGQVDIVVPNAGVAELGSFETVKYENGVPCQPQLTTIDVNLTGVLYSVYLAQHFLNLNSDEDSWKSIVLIGSMASWKGIVHAPLYSATKHSILGLMRSMHLNLESQGIRIAVIHPWFADTNILPIAVKLMLAGIPLTPVSRIAGAIFYAAVDPDPNTNGCAWLLADDGPLFMVPKEEFKLGVYKMLDNRVNALTKGTAGVVFYAQLVRDLGRILRKPIIGSLVVGLAATIIWNRIGSSQNSAAVEL